MKDEDIKLPKMISLVNSVSWNNDIEEYARQAVRMNMPQPKPSEPEPFDLARAMAGEPIVTRDGRKVKFLAHVPEASTFKVVVFVEGDIAAINLQESGRVNQGLDDERYDLFMAPKPKRTVWVNVWGVKNCQNFATSAHESKERATEVAADNFGCKYLAIAHPIEIDA